MAGDCAFVPNTTIESDHRELCTYVLLTGYDLSGSGSNDDLAVRILAVAGWDNMCTKENSMCTKENRIKYHLLSFTSGGGAQGFGSRLLPAGAWAHGRRCWRMAEQSRFDPVYMCIKVMLLAGCSTACKGLFVWHCWLAQGEADTGRRDAGDGEATPVWLFTISRAGKKK
jgi:hypothetical protein